jgi:hypothetical protein
MEIFVVLDSFCQEKTNPNKANLFSPQHCWGLKKQSQFTGMANRRKLLFERNL